MNRAYSIFEVKAVDDAEGLITGIATTPEADRMGDVVDPKGAKFKLPMPLLWQHRSDEPIGQVIAAKITNAGIEIKAKIAVNLLPRIDEAFALIKSGLVRGLSIGFRPTERPELIEESFGLRFKEWEWLELSAVTVPANASATIQTIKSIDTHDLAALGTGLGSLPQGSAGVPASNTKASRKGARPMKTITEQIDGFVAKRNESDARLSAIMQKAADEGVTLDAAQKEEYDTLADEVKEIDDHLVRLRALEQRNKAAAKPVAGSTPELAAHSRDPQAPIIRVKQNREPGAGMARSVIAHMAAYMSKGVTSPLEIAKHRWPDDVELQTYIKTAIAAGTTTDSTWAAPLVDQTTLSGEFIEYLRPMTIIGKFGTNGIPSLKPLPFNIRIPSQTGGFTGYWVGEGAAKPVSKGAFDAVTVPYTKAAALAVITKELARFSSPSAETIVRNQLAAAVVERLDRDFINPDIAAVSGVKPASITNGVTALSSAGTSADNARTDIQNLIEQFILNNVDPTGLVLIMPNTLALALSVLVNSLGQPEFPGLTMRGGTLMGIPVITSQYAASSGANGNMVIAANANDIGLADDGQVSIEVSGEASIEMSDAPSATSATPTAASVVSMFQTNSLAILAERFIHWKKLRSTAVSFMDDVNWGSIGSPA